MLIFHTAICVGASQIATDGRRELDVLVATPSLRSGMEVNMKKGNNPYSISFGRIPARFISRDVSVIDILDALNADEPTEMAFKLTGIRGAGKTVTLSEIERELRKDDKWIVVDLKSGGEITNDLVSELYSREDFITKYVDANLNLSAFGIGLKVSKKSPVSSIDVALRNLIEEIAKKKKRILVVIDEIRKTDAIVDFIQTFQILIRADLPIYLIVAGLYEDIESVENTDGLTFFLRAESVEMTPLSREIIREDYRQTLGLPYETAKKLANMTKGYAFAYQVFGKYMWDAGGDEISDLVLAQVDNALAIKVYNKLWSELSDTEKWYMSFIVRKEKMPVSELLELTKKSHSDWSRPRKKLKEKRIIDTSERGEIRLLLPRFKEYVEGLNEV